MEKVAHVRPLEKGTARVEGRRVVLGKLIDELEEAIASGVSIPMTSQSLIDRGRCLELIDLLRTSLPGEVVAARRIIESEEKVLSDARAEAERICQRAEKEAALILEENQLMRMAELRSQSIIQEGEREAERIVGEAEGRAYEIYLRLEHALDLLKAELKETLASSQKGEPLE
jgi:vacuolar-type H+-ATPase subunit H